jgi:hypothetical protein
MSGGGTTSSTTTQKFEPPGYITNYDGNGGNYYSDAINAQKDISSRPYQSYNLPTVAPLNDLQDTGLKMAADYGMNGSPYGNQARSLGLSTMKGDFLNSNPYLDQNINDTAANMTRSFQQGTAAQTDAAAARAGAFGGSAYNQLTSQNAAGLANSIGQMANTARMGNYNTERGYQNQAMGMAPQFSADDMNGIKSVTGAGDAYGAYTQKLLDAGKSSFDAQNNYPQDALNRFLATLNQASGTNGGQTTSQSLPGQSLLGLLGGLGAGAYGVSQLLPK